jgi:hypothetical protein
MSAVAKVTLPPAQLRRALEFAPPRTDPAHAGRRTMTTLVQDVLPLLELAQQASGLPPGQVVAWLRGLVGAAAGIAQADDLRDLGAHAEALGRALLTSRSSATD